MKRDCGSRDKSEADLRSENAFLSDSREQLARLKNMRCILCGSFCAFALIASAAQVGKI